MSEDFGLSPNIQDKIINLIIFDLKFIEQCVRKKLESNIFSSDIQRTIVDLCLEYYSKYTNVPGMDNLIDIIGLEINKNTRIKKDNFDAYAIYLEKIFNLRDTELEFQFLVDNLDDFTKKRTISKLTNNLIKLRDRLDVDIEKPIKLIREAIVEIESKTNIQVAESITEENELSSFSNDIVTRFNIPDIDDQLKGGFKIEQFGVILGYQGVGKSWCISHLAKMATRYGEISLVIDLERSNKRVKLRFKMTFTGMTEEEIINSEKNINEQIKKSFVKKSNVVLLNEDEKIMRVENLTSVLDSVEEKYHKRPRLILLDSADALLPPIGRYREKREEFTAIYTYLKNYAKDHKVCIITTTQAKTEAGKKFWTTHFDTSEDINKIRKAVIGISINSLDNEKDLEYLRLYLFKNTDGEAGAKVWVKRDFNRGQLITDWGTYERLKYEEMMKLAES